MPIRTDAASVRTLIDPDTSNLDPFISQASQLVDRKVAPRYDADEPADVELLELIERTLAAHFICVKERPLQAESVKGVSETRSPGSLGLYLQGSQYGQSAISMDVSGALASYQSQLVKGKGPVVFEWMGTDCPRT